MYVRRINLYNRLDDNQQKKSWVADHVIIPLNDRSFFSILIAVYSIWPKIGLGNVQITIMKILVLQCSLDATTYTAGPMGRVTDHRYAVPKLRFVHSTHLAELTPCLTTIQLG